MSKMCASLSPEAPSRGYKMLFLNMSNSLASRLDPEKDSRQRSADMSTYLHTRGGVSDAVLKGNHFPEIQRPSNVGTRPVCIRMYLRLGDHTSTFVSTLQLVAYVSACNAQQT